MGQRPEEKFVRDGFGYLDARNLDAFFALGSSWRRARRSPPSSARRYGGRRGRSRRLWSTPSRQCPSEWVGGPG
jgi:hypothetical protein